MDLISDLIAAHETGETLTNQELVDFCIVLLVAGNVQGIERFTKVETLLMGQTIPAEQMVLVWMGSANRDETQFDHPDEFVVEETLKEWVWNR